MDLSKVFSHYASVDHPWAIELLYFNKGPIFRAEPDLEFEGLLKRQHTRVKYFQGSLMSAIDLERAKVKKDWAMKLNKASHCIDCNNFAASHYSFSYILLLHTHHIFCLPLTYNITS